MTVSRRRSPALRLYAALAVVVLLGACGSSAPTAAGPSAEPIASDRASGSVPDATEIARAHALGPWRPAPILPDESQVTAVVEACRLATDEGAAQPAGRLPVAVLDARGEGRFVVVFADGKSAADCRATVDDAGTPTVDGVAALDLPAQVEATGIAIVEIGPDFDRPERVRKTLIGVVGSDAFKVKAHFADDTYVTASMANGWYVAWWPGRDDPITVAAVDNKNLAIGGTAP